MRLSCPRGFRPVPLRPGLWASLLFSDEERTRILISSPRKSPLLLVCCQPLVGGTGLGLQDYALVNQDVLILNEILAAVAQGLLGREDVTSLLDAAARLQVLLFPITV